MEATGFYTDMRLPSKWAGVFLFIVVPVLTPRGVPPDSARSTAQSGQVLCACLAG